MYRQIVIIGLTALLAVFYFLIDFKKVIESIEDHQSRKNK